VQIGEIATPATGHQNFFTNLIAAIKHEYFSPTLTCRQGTKKTGCTATNDNTINTRFLYQRFAPPQIQSSVYNSR
jgi:hypothetical protein